jgi:hypothetical protein
MPTVFPLTKPPAARAAVIRVELRAESFDVPVEVVLVKNLIQPGVERMCVTAR